MGRRWGLSREVWGERERRRTRECHQYDLNRRKTIYGFLCDVEIERSLAIDVALMWASFKLDILCISSEAIHEGRVRDSYKFCRYSVKASRTSDTVGTPYPIAPLAPSQSTSKSNDHPLNKSCTNQAADTAFTAYAGW